MYHIKPVIALKRFRIVAHSFGASFPIKMCLDDKTNIIS